MIGHELGGRYQIIERIGGGGMALVYKAQDILLGRNVAIKVLRQQFVHDEEFIRRFRREAQSAASLSHPNVVSIYDVGQEDEIHYIVMEYIEGQNLNEIIKERAPLQVDEAVRIATQICDALDHAHHNQIIHRDIKPHNILIGRNGRVKVTDFGIARAVSSTTITQTGSVVGSVHYFSPEHAKGVVTGEKSDLYSLGIVLYEMLTSKLPFLGESPISVALKHLQESFEEPRLVNPLIPQSVENIILKSMRKNPNERYQSAKEMLRDLETCLLPERRLESKIVFDDADDADKTRVIPAIKPPVQRPAAGRTSRVDDPDEGSKPQAAKSKNPKKAWVKPTLWIGITLLVILFMLGVAWYVNQSLNVPNVKVPKLIGLQEDAARAELTKAGLKVQDPITRAYKEGVAAGVVYEQGRPEGAEVKKDTPITLTVSVEKPLKKLPDLSGQSYEDAKKKLMDDFQMDGSQITRKDDYSDADPGKVTGQNPAAGSDFDPAKDTVELTVSKGPQMVTMPDLTNLTQSQAEAKLKELGLKLAKDGITQESSYSVDEGKVFKQHPYGAGEQVPPGTEFTLVVSSGYPPEAVTYTYNVPIAPKTEGKKSKIRLVYTDARGDNKEATTRTINTVQTIPVNLVLSPTKNGAILIYRDGEYLDTLPVSYIDAKQGTVPVPSVPVGQEQVEQTPPPDDNNSGDNGTAGDSAAINGGYQEVTDRFASGQASSKEVLKAQKEKEKAEKKRK
ncbi:Stk1 family PASTA domain-containing Ser/Thr kinase [Paenibacillus tuaregi]|uniref:Stk1 family PASTA domain-containing Ser/Thr kinase n=1 Tax=Paenibacillus tuaregi TaxID=1816681 RepID=UPI000837C71A|nr:Stk1 family PASTA domain-containing Ser/Thr kinase [Paenibacillus tuaregi]